VFCGPDRAGRIQIGDSVPVRLGVPAETGWAHPSVRYFFREAEFTIRLGRDFLGLDGAGALFRRARLFLNVDTGPWSVSYPWVSTVENF